MLLNHYSRLYKTSNYGVITPYIVPRSLGKRPNSGDGFILDACISLLGRAPVKIFSQWANISPQDREEINKLDFLLVAGANILKDDLRITPNLSFKLLNEITVPIVLMGVGHYGHLEATKHGPNQESQKILLELISRFPLISVRCQHSQNYLCSSISSLANSVVMTSCPVFHHKDMIPAKATPREPESSKSTLVTISDRNDFEDQMYLLTLAKNQTKSDFYALSLHQNYLNTELWRRATDLGYDIFWSDDFRDYISLYGDFDLHLGTRLHAHLKFLANGRPSYMAGYDQRQVYFAESIGTPLISSREEKLPTIDFDDIEKRRSIYNVGMQLFLEKLRELTR